MEEGQDYKDKRLFLEKLREEKDSELLYSLWRKKYASEKEEGKALFLVFFEAGEVLALIGAGQEN